MGAVAVPGREVAAAGEAVNIADVAYEAGGAGGTDAGELPQVAARGIDQVGELLVGGLDLLVEGGQFGDQFGGELPAGAPDDVAGSDGSQQSTGLGSGQILLRAAWYQFQQQGVEAVDGVGAGLANQVAAVDEQSQRDGGIVGGDLSAGPAQAGGA